MVNFTKEISDPRNQISIFSPATNSSSDSAASILGALTRTGSAIVGAVSNEREKEEARQREKTISDFDIAVSGAISGQNVDTRDQAAIDTVAAPSAEEEKIISGGLKPLETINAGVKQGRTNPQNALVRTLAVEREFKSRHPELAGEFNKRAKALLGKTPTQISFEESLEAEDFAQEQERAVQNSFVQEAANNGVGFLNQDGTVDIEQTALAGQRILLSKARLDKMKRDIEIGRGGRSQAELDSTLTTQATGEVDTLIELKAQSVFSQITAATQDLTDFDSKSQAQELALRLQSVKTETQAEINRVLASSDYSKEVRDNISSHISNRFKPFEDLFSGDLSIVKQNANSLKLLQDSTNMKAIEIAPSVALTRAALGDSALAALTSLRNIATGDQPTLENEIESLFNNNGLGAMSKMQDAQRIATTPTPIAAMEPARAQEVIKSSKVMLDTYNSNASVLQPNELSAWTNTSNNLLEAMRSIGTSEQLVNTDQLIFNEEWVNTVLLNKSDPQVQQVAGKALQATQNIIAIVPEIFDSFGEFADFETFKLSFNDSSGELKIEVDEAKVQEARGLVDIDKNPLGKNTGLASFIASGGQVVPEPADIRKVEFVNNILNTAASLKEFDKSLRNLSESDTKRFIIETFAPDIAERVIGLNRIREIEDNDTTFVEPK